jgi:hypothetical protein
MSDPLLETMRYYGIPLTRENYLNLAYLGEEPKLDAEQEAALPVELE